VALLLLLLLLLLVQPHCPIAAVALWGRAVLVLLGPAIEEHAGHARTLGGGVGVVVWVVGA